MTTAALEADESPQHLKQVSRVKHIILQKYGVLCISPRKDICEDAYVALTEALSQVNEKNSEAKWQNSGPEKGTGGKRRE